MQVLALFGPTAVGKTGVAIAVAEALRGLGEDPVAVNCDSIQVYRGLETLSGAADEEQRGRLEHRLLSFVGPGEEFSAGRYAEAAHREIDALLADRRRPIVVGGTGLYLRAALADLDLRPPVPAGDPRGGRGGARGAGIGGPARGARRRAGREGRPERPQADRAPDGAVPGGDRGVPPAPRASGRRSFGTRPCWWA